MSVNWWFIWATTFRDRPLRLYVLIHPWDLEGERPGSGDTDRPGHLSGKVTRPRADSKEDSTMVTLT